ncbi:glucosamine-6-phosphate deaminase [Tumebacillus algifaecis]|uniref:Glucosamine-6-phosphate deaminase n=1 Tax=Tumebacillus algifaecis TaxID=1214604 RepID=A0A223D1B6_9BACL|nr:glucosamine-6-phosphate deaminase [Tumebacillus algifaecis]ASS75331.1 glucosamine-6-phosphate deaminase [Tumebacillus algifaecis]
MKLLVERDYDSISKRAAALVAEQIANRPDLVVGLATGSTPLGLYRYLIEEVQQGRLSLAAVKTFNLDEYLGLAPDHPQSYRSFMEENLFSQIDVVPANTHIPNGQPDDIAEHCAAYERLIVETGGIDIQVLGIGRNGHIGFNEPGEAFGRPTHLVKLAESTRQANARFFSHLGEVPTHAITMGLKSIMNARRVLLLAAGADKSEAVYRAVCGDVSEDHPASVLQLHPDCIFLLDEAAAALLPAELRQDKGMRW